MKQVIKNCRKRVDWYELVIESLSDPAFSYDWYTHYLGNSKLSLNRRCWNILKKYYSTTALNYYRTFGVLPSLDPVLLKMEECL